MLKRVVLLPLLLVLFMVFTLAVVMSQTWEDWNKKGMDLYGKGDYEGAIKCYDKALAEKPSAYGVWYNRGMAYYKQGIFDKAVGSFNEALKYKSDLTNAWLKKGLCLNKLGKYSEAIKCFDYVLSKNPNDPDAKSGREEAKKKEGSQPVSTGVSDGDKQALKDWYDKGFGLYSEGKYNEAIECLDRATGIDSKYADGWYLKGCAYGKLKNYEKALECYNRFLEIKPGDMTVAEKKQEAVAELDKKKKTGDLYNRGVALGNEGKYDEAIVCFDEILKIDAGNVEAQGKKAEIEGIKRQKTVVEVYDKGLALFNEGKYEEAVKCFDEVLKAEPGNVDAKGKKEQIVAIIEMVPPMVYIKGGTFMMGSNDGDKDEKPVHQVTVSDFYLGKYELTNKYYCMYQPGYSNSGNDLPVVNVSWTDAVGYCEWLSQKTGLKFRLPTEAEWEYSCRAGSNTEYYWGNSDNMIDSYCWYKDNSGGTVHTVGQKQPNGFGLYDMSGNVWEWCNDWYGENYYSGSSSSNPAGPSSGSYRVFRGGSWSNNADLCRSAVRGRNAPAHRDNSLGFRLCRTP